MDVLTLGYENGGRLVLSDPKRGPDGELWSIVVRVEHKGLRSESRIAAHWATHFDDLVAYLDGLAQDWRGWTGTKTYLSLEGDLAIQADHDGVGHVCLAVTLKGPTAPPAWTVTAEVTTDPGAQMAEAASIARTLLAARI